MTDDRLTPWIWLLLPGIPLHELCHYAAATALGGSPTADWSEPAVWIVWDDRPSRLQLALTAFAPWAVGVVLLPAFPHVSQALVDLLGSGPQATGLALLVLVNYFLLAWPSLSDFRSATAPLQG